jgi:hypothetical protein
MIIESGGGAVHIGIMTAIIWEVPVFRNYCLPLM